MKRLVAFGLIVLLHMGIHANPFTAEGEKEFSSSKSVTARIIDVQKGLHKQIGVMFKEAKNRNSALLSFLALTFMYGIFHSLGPGHRKTIIAAYASKPKTSSKKTLILSVGFALLHSTASIVLVGGTVTVTKLVTGMRAGQSIQQATRVAEFGSYSLVALLGAYMIWEVFSHIRSHKKEDPESKDVSFWGVLVSGIVPCPGASLILILSVTQKAFYIGVLGVITMSIGMAMVLAGIGIASFALRWVIQKQVGKTKVWANRFAYFAEGAAATVVFVFGVLMVYGTLNQPVGF